MGGNESVGNIREELWVLSFGGKGVELREEIQKRFKSVEVRREAR
jgi:hypothetical protein